MFTDYNAQHMCKRGAGHTQSWDVSTIMICYTLVERTGMFSLFGISLISIQDPQQIVPISVGCADPTLEV